ncbi:MAG TPA: FAD-binding oxidoreductase [Steroidobacteraceae bacterium]|nr:FAD-binding oxidoreductase [Steroidobacteraceae bacterium]
MKRREFFAATLAGAVAATLPVRRLYAESAAAAAPDTDLNAIKLGGGQTIVPKAAVADLRSQLRGSLLVPGQDGYEQARRIWNHMIDKHPALIARCAGPADVAAAVQFAREHELVTAVRGGGHSFPGYSTCDGGLVVDLSMMHGVRVDPVAKTARAEGGAWLGDLDAESQHYGLATTLGAISNTGIAGLTLGGGYGWLCRRFGLACDNLISADLITADGQFHRLSEQDNPDLFWGIRGGGGNFGVVTSFEYRLHPVGPKVLAGSVAYPASQLRQVLEFYADFASHAPRELHVEFDAVTALDSGPSSIISVCYSADPKAGEKALEPLVKFGKPTMNTIKMQDYVAVQKQYDGPPLSEHNSYLKSGFMRELTPKLIDTIVNLPPDEMYDVAVSHFGGAVGDRGPTDTAFTHREANFMVFVSAAWKDSADNDRNRSEVRARWDKLKPFTAGYYVNLNEGDQRQTDDNYGPNHARLAGLKRQYDPTNLFRLNANVRPA